MGERWYFAELCGIIEVMEEKNYGTIRTEMIESLRAENKALKDENAELSQKVEWLMVQLRLLKKKQFGASSEQSKGQLDGQLSFLFNEAEAYAAPPGPQKTTQVAAHTRKRFGSAKDVVPETIPVEGVEHRLSEEERVCPQCGELMREIGTEVRETLKLILAKAILRRDVYYTYAGENCEKNDVSTPIMKAPKEPSVIPGSFASAQAIAHIMTQKFVIASPLYRQEQEWARQGLKLSRQTMSNWVLRAAEVHLLPVYKALHRQLVKREVLHADESTLQVLHEPGKKAQTKSYMWLYRTGQDDGPPIVLYEYQPNRKAEHVEKFLEGFSGYLDADGYQGYHKLPGNIRAVGCWAHARRKFDEALCVLPPDKWEGTAALTSLEYCNKLFAWEGAVQGAFSRRTGKTSSERGNADFRRAFDMGGFRFRRSQVRAGQSLALPQGAMALSPAVSGGGTAGAEQQPGRAQYQTLRDWAQELPVCQYSTGCLGQYGNLQPY